jgi:hypothetical protein
MTRSWARSQHHRPPKPGTVPPAERKAASTCPACGKDCYTSKKLAKQSARRLFPGATMRVYLCLGSPYYHLTSQGAKKTAIMRAWASGQPDDGSPPAA